MHQKINKMICRCCAKYFTETLIPIAVLSDTHRKPLKSIINFIVDEVQENEDRFPQQICQNCLEQLQLCYNVLEQCRNAFAQRSSKVVQNKRNCRSCIMCNVSNPQKLFTIDCLITNSKHKIRDMVNELSPGALFPKTENNDEESSFQVCCRCAKNMKESYNFKMKLTVVGETFSRQYLHPWELMDYDIPGSLAVDLYAELVPKSKGYECSVCRFNVESTMFEKTCSGCLLNFNNYEQICTKNQEDCSSTEQFSETNDVIIELRATLGGPSSKYGFVCAPFRERTCLKFICCVRKCQKQFLRASSLKTHLSNQHKPISSKPGHCQYCNLKLVRGINHNAKQCVMFSCKVEGCVYRTTSRIVMKSHKLHDPIIDKKHKRIIEKKKPSTENAYTCSEKSMFVCCAPECTSKFTTSLLLKEHQTNNHRFTECLSLIGCGYCGRNFDTITAKTNHQLQKYKIFRCKERHCSFVSKNEKIVQLHCVTGFHQPKRHVEGGFEYDPNFFTVIGSLDKCMDVLRLDGEKCCGCQKMFSSVVDLEKHIENTHKTDVKADFQCDKCYKVFVDPKLVSRHRLGFESQKKYYHCRKCDKFMWYSYLAMQHIVSSHDIDDQNVIPNDDRYQAIHDDGHMCCCCMERFETKEELKMHCAEHQSRGAPSSNDVTYKYKCEICNKKFEQLPAFMRHGAAFRRKEVFQCLIPNCTFKTKDLLEIHIHVELGNIEKVHRDTNGYTFSTAADESHCCFSSCDHQSGSYNDLVEHALSKHFPEREVNKKCNETYLIGCPICCKGYRSFALLMRHRNFKSKNSKLKHLKKQQVIDAAKPREMINCEICHRSCEKSKLSNHMHNNHAVRKSCALCGKSFNKYNLTLHMISHENKRMFECDQCPATFNLKSFLIKHVRSCHSNERPFHCRQGCSKTYKHAGDRDRHEKTVHLRILPWSCELCDSSFVRERDLRIHQRKHTGIRLFPCNYCKASFDKKSDFNEHLLEHSEYCEDQFTPETL
ncbi:zinc finger protein 845-like isoform X2 [Uranotaenia lowii]|uniref:zinc finger protein 845-like isoform X2 n=1 Tax=Uranotaenia lowii TaxID=190385 RepID=UPI00247A5191|nr:zinc finger protein 845-like isoform X2 [Uranotaenia lowii]